MRRKYGGLFVVVVVLMTAVTTFSGISTASAAVDPGTAEQQFLMLLNQARAANGMPGMARDGRIDNVARAWSASMANVYTQTGEPVVKPYAPNDCRQSSLCHRPDLVAQLSAVEPGWQMIGENIGVGFSVQSLHDGLLASSGHRANILGNYNRVGIGVVTQGERIWVTFDFLNGPPLPGGAPDGAAKVNPPPDKVPGPVTALSARTRYNPVSPVRVLDTRSGLGGFAGLVGAGGTLRLQVAGTSLVPRGAGGVALNVTATEPRGSGWLTAYPCGQARPNASNLNVDPMETRANQVVAALDGTGQLCIFTSVTTYLIADLAGWYGGSGSAYRPVSPTRVYDSRNAGGRVRSAAVSLAGAVSGDATAVTLNVTAADPTASGYVTVYPCGTAPPNASNLNYGPGQTVPNLVTVKLGAGQQVCLSSFAPAYLIVDLAGSYGNSGATLTTAVPERFLDSRDATGGWLGQVAPSQRIEVGIGGVGGVPSGATAAVLNVTVTGAQTAGYLVVFPCDAPTNASNLNYVPGDTVANLVIVRLDGSGRVCVSGSGRSYVLADLAGWFTN